MCLSRGATARHSVAISVADVVGIAFQERSRPLGAPHWHFTLRSRPRIRYRY